MRNRVFISFRKDTDWRTAETVAAVLSQGVGKDRLFYSEGTDSIGGGQKWLDTINANLDVTRVMVLVIGPDWLDALRDREADDERDIHRHEIMRALREGIDVIPVLVDDTPLEEEDLPVELRGILDFQTRRIDSERLLGSLSTLVEDVTRGLGEPEDGSGAPGRTEGDGGSAAADRRTITVGPLGSEAEFHELADAVDAAPAGARIKVAPGRYLRPVVVARPVVIFAEERGEAVIEADGVCLDIRASRTTVNGLNVVTSSPHGGVGIVVAAEQVEIDRCDVNAGRTPGSVGIRCTEAADGFQIDASTVHHVEVGIEVTGEIEGLVVDCEVHDATGAGIRISDGADPRVRRTSFHDIDAPAIDAGPRGFGLIEDCGVKDARLALRSRQASRPRVRGRQGRAGAVREALASMGGERFDKLDLSVITRRRERGQSVRLAEILVGAQRDWSFAVLEGGDAEIESCDIESLGVHDGATVTVQDCQISALTASAATVTAIDCGLREVSATHGAQVTLSECAVAPAPGNDKTSYRTPPLRISEEATVHLERSSVNCEQNTTSDGNGEWTAVRVNGGSLVVEESTVVAKRGTGIIQVGGQIRLNGATVRSSYAMPAMTIEGGTLTTDASSHLRSSLVAREGATLHLSDTTFHKEVEISDPAEVTFADCTVSGDLRMTSRETPLRFDRGQLAGTVALTECASVTMTDVDVTSTIELGSDARLRSCTLHGGRVQGTGVELDRCTVRSGTLAIGPEASARLNACTFSGGGYRLQVDGRAHVAGGVMEGMRASGDDREDAAIYVTEAGSITVERATIKDAQPIEPFLPRWLAGKKRKAKLARWEAMGGARVLSVLPGGEARFVLVEFESVGNAPLLVAEGARVTMTDCTLDGTLWNPNAR